VILQRRHRRSAPKCFRSGNRGGAAVLHLTLGQRRHEVQRALAHRDRALRQPRPQRELRSAAHLAPNCTATLNDDGRVDARIATGWDAYAPLAGEVASIPTN
jgi:hypothetical protein